MVIFALTAVGQIAIPAFDIAMGRGDGAGYEWSGTVSSLIIITSCMLGVTVIILAFRNHRRIPAEKMR